MHIVYEGNVSSFSLLCAHFTVQALVRKWSLPAIEQTLPFENSNFFIERGVVGISRANDNPVVSIGEKDFLNSFLVFVVVVVVAKCERLLVSCSFT